MLKRFFKSLKYSFRGLKFAFTSEQNFRIQTAVAILVIVGMILLPLKVLEIVVILIMIILVLIMEILNTALEYFTDLLKPRLHSYVYTIKDLMSAAVLVSSLGALIIGLIIFFPYLLDKFRV